MPRASTSEVKEHSHWNNCSEQLFQMGPNITLNDAETLDTRKWVIESRDISPLFQDAVDVARILVIKCLWIDLLRVIQGDDQELQAQASNMDKVCRKASLVLAAAPAISEHDCILNKKDTEYDPIDPQTKANRNHAVGLRGRRLFYPLGKQHNGCDYGTVSTQA
jgi:hypothetical protein